MDANETERFDEYFSGARLHGDDFPLGRIEQWYKEEENGYFDLLNTYYKILEDDGAYKYEYSALNEFHVIGKLLERHHSCCVALGCAAGDDVAPLAPAVDRFVAVEPAEKWWRDSIGGKPAQYLKPLVSGDIDIATGSADLVTSIGVLHHIPNVSHVVGEVARILRPGGLFAVREPISWMGDWRYPRPGLTNNERGLPLDWFERMSREKGFRIVRRRLCMLGPLWALARKLRIEGPFRSGVYVKIDWLLSEALRWNIRYRRQSIPQKFAPGSAFWLLEKQPGS